MVHIGLRGFGFIGFGGGGYIVALIIRIGFWCPLYYNYGQEPLK